MFSTYPYWDVSYLVAVIFTLGSVVWCINAFFVWLPLEDPASEFPGEISDAGGWTAFIGATIFELGSILLMIEAVNENRADCFGWALEEVLEERGLMRLRPSPNCRHHHKNKGNLVGKGKALEGERQCSFVYECLVSSVVQSQGRAFVLQFWAPLALKAWAASKFLDPLITFAFTAQFGMHRSRYLNEWHTMSFQFYLPLDRNHPTHMGVQRL